MENKLKKAAYIDHSFKKKTKSNEFLKEILRNEYNLVELWDNSSNEKKGIDINHLNENNFETIFFFQCIPSIQDLKKIICKNIVWFPMYDQELKKKYYSYIPLLDFNIKIFSFSKKLYLKFKKLGLNCYYYKYQLQPIRKCDRDTSKKKIFFWYRISDINWNIVKTLIGNNKIDKIILKMTPDPNNGIKIPSKEDIKKYNIKIIDKWVNKDEYNKLLISCNIFMAPRKAEGIGMSFIEALSHGLCVIANDDSTMNEYIADGKNGLLFKHLKPRELNLNNFVDLGNNAFIKAKEDYEEWEEMKWNILSDLKMKNKTQNLLKYLYFKFIFYIYNLYLIIYNELKVVFRKIIK